MKNLQVGAVLTRDQLIDVNGRLLAMIEELSDQPDCVIDYAHAILSVIRDAEATIEVPTMRVPMHCGGGCRCAGRHGAGVIMGSVRP